MKINIVKQTFVIFAFSLKGDYNYNDIRRVQHDVVDFPECKLKKKDSRPCFDNNITY